MDTADKKNMYHISSAPKAGEELCSELHICEDRMEAICSYINKIIDYMYRVEESLQESIHRFPVLVEDGLHYAKHPEKERQLKLVSHMISDLITLLNTLVDCKKLIIDIQTQIPINYTFFTIHLETELAFMKEINDAFPNRFPSVPSFNDENTYVVCENLFEKVRHLHACFAMLDYYLSCRISAEQEFIRDYETILASNCDVTSMQDKLIIQFYEYVHMLLGQGSVAIRKVCEALTVIDSLLCTIIEPKKST